MQIKLQREEIYLVLRKRLEDVKDAPYYKKVNVWEDTLNLYFTIEPYESIDNTPYLVCRNLGITEDDLRWWSNVLERKDYFKRLLSK